MGFQHVDDQITSNCHVSTFESPLIRLKPTKNVSTCSPVRSFLGFHLLFSWLQKAGHPRLKRRDVLVRRAPRGMAAGLAATMAANWKAGYTDRI